MQLFRKKKILNNQNACFVRLFATKVVSNESWIVSEYTYMYQSESQEETILSQHFSSLFCSVYFFAPSAASYLGTDVTDLRAITSEMSPLPTSQRCFCVTAINSLFSLSCLGTNFTRMEIKFLPTCCVNHNFVNKTKYVEFQFTS